VLLKLVRRLLDAIERTVQRTIEPSGRRNGRRARGWWRVRCADNELPARGRREIGALLRAYDARGRTVAPDRAMFDAAGDTLRRLKAEGREIRGASLVSDVLIAHTARSLGAAVVTRDTDFETIRAVLDFDLDLLAA